MGDKFVSCLGEFSIADDVDEEKAYLLHAHLASLLDGLEVGHIDTDAFDAFLSALRDNLQAARIVDAAGSRTGVRIRAEPMWNLFADAVATAANSTHPCGRPVGLADTRNSEADFGGRDLVTIGRLEFQTEMVKRGAVGLGRRKFEKVSRADIVRKAGNRGELAEIVECCNHALEQGMVTASDYLKGDPASITWVSPVESRVQVLLARADAYGLRKTDLTDLRNLLGLWAENGKNKRPLAAFFLYCRAGLAAPNVFTAQGYERFRHRPPDTMIDSPNSGLTYNLDRKSVALHLGACEIVADAITLTQVKRMEAGGQPARFRFDRDAELASHRQYSEDVHRGRSISDVLGKLELLVP